MSYVSKFVSENEITFLCEHWLIPGEVSGINDKFRDSWCYAKSSVGPDVLAGRPYGGVGFICQKLYCVTQPSVE